MTETTTQPSNYSDIIIHVGPKSYFINSITVDEQVRKGKNRRALSNAQIVLCLFLLRFFAPGIMTTRGTHKFMVQAVKSWTGQETNKLIETLESISPQTLDRSLHLGLNAQTKMAPDVVNNFTTTTKFYNFLDLDYFTIDDFGRVLSDSKMSDRNNSWIGEAIGDKYLENRLFLRVKVNSGVNENDSTRVVENCTFHSLPASEQATSCPYYKETFLQRVMRVLRRWFS